MVAALRRQDEICRPAEIAAYVDGELDSESQLCLESHLQDCEQCRIELRNHRMLICELNAALVKSPDLTMPDGFSKVVAARASSDMSGVRSAAENRRALGICFMLAAVGFALVGFTAPRSAVLRGRRLAEASAALMTFLWTAVYDAFASVTVVVRVIGRKFLFETKSIAMALILLALAVFLLSRLITRYHRTSATE
jgi:anti-sigma factor RsiW